MLRVLPDDEVDAASSDDELPHPTLKWLCRTAEREGRNPDAAPQNWIARFAQ
jgi:hypothetical protein